MKSRGVYETPAGTVIMEAHAKLEQICLDRKTLAFKMQVGQKFADTLYEGEWFCPLREALCAFIDSTQRNVTGTVRLKLWKGSIADAGMKSPYSLYDASLASFTTGPLFSHKDSEGFINLFGLPTKVRARLNARIAADGAALPKGAKLGKDGFEATAGD
jgi:argininosuccinate synthase